MASDSDEGLNTDQKIRRSAARTVFNWLVTLVALGVIGGWASTGIYYTQPGEGAVVLYFGRYHETVRDEGMHWHLPAPLGYHDTVKVSEVRRLEFGFESQEFDEGDQDVEPIHEHEVQTSDSNIVIPRYVVQYKVGDAFSYLYSLKDPTQTLRDATQAAMREVIGRYGVDEVFEKRDQVEREAKQGLEEMLARYARASEGEPAFEILRIGLQSIQPPPKVQGAFDDVVAARQDRDRAISEANGDAQEIRERAGAQAVELTESAEAYKSAKVLDATGEAKRFELLLAEYRKAREVTRRRLYFEAMEDVMQGVDKFVVEPDTVQMLPLLSLPNAAAPRPSPPAKGEEEHR